MGYGYGYRDREVQDRGRGRAGSSRRRDEKHKGSRRRGKPRSSYSSSDSRSSSGTSGGEGSGGDDKSGDSDKDEIVHFAWSKGQVLNSRYRMLKLLGDGTFGRVLLAQDQRHNRQVAIKVIRDVKRYVENAKIEADILQDISRADPEGSASRSAIMYDTFMLGTRHFCLVFEALGVSLYDFLKQNDFRGFFLQDIQSFAKQSLKALNFLHERLSMTHTDLKPENILLQSMDTPRPAEFPRMCTSKNGFRTQYVRPTNNRIKLIDFGNATYEDEHHSSIINTRQYRGPEVILSLGWNELSDIWSLGCILMELYTGELLFSTHENFEHLALMERILEPFPLMMLDRSDKSMKEKYTKTDRWGCRLRWPEGASSASSERHVRQQPRLKELALPEHGSFASFVGHLLTLDPAKRPSAAKGLRHAFLGETFSD